MKKIYKIPIIGYLFKIAVSIVKGPMRFEALWSNQENMQQQINAQMEIIKQQNNEIENRRREIEDRGREIEDCRQEIEERRQEIEERRQEIEDRRQEIEDRRQEIIVLQKKNKQIEDELFQNGFETLLKNEEQLEKLNMELSIHPTIWGDKEKVHISPLAAVFSCFFNTNSGSIYIGDYTFAGSGVSILAGSHDMYLDGLSRRDCEYKEGYDINIGEGVWLASGCTILGPCTIGDNAVVASGAVVVPGTVIPENSVYAGVPAKKVKEIIVSDEEKKEHLVAAMYREGGVLFEKGWSERRQILYEKREIQGHWLIQNEASILTNRTAVTIHFHLENADTADLTLECGNEHRRIVLSDRDQIVEIQLSEEKSPRRILVRKNTDQEAKVFASILGEKE